MRKRKKIDSSTIILSSVIVVFTIIIFLSLEFLRKKYNVNLVMKNAQKQLKDLFEKILLSDISSSLNEKIKKRTKWTKTNDEKKNQKEKEIAAIQTYIFLKDLS